MPTETLVTSEEADQVDATLADNVAVAAQNIGFSRATGYIEIRSGRLESFKVRSRRLVSRKAQRRYVLAREAEARAAREAEAAREAGLRSRK